MDAKSLIFNIITFEFPSENQTFYFSKEYIEKSVKIHKNLFPKKIESIFPDINNDNTDFIYTTFNEKKEDLKSIDINFSEENEDFIKKYYNFKINFYFKHIKKLIVKKSFINDNQIWIPDPQKSSSSINVYKKFSIRVQFKTVSNSPELLLSYDGISKILTNSVSKLINKVPPEQFNLVLNDNILRKWRKMQEDGKTFDYSKYYPVLNKKIQRTLKIPFTVPPHCNQYIKYLENIRNFNNTYLADNEFAENTGLSKMNGFIDVEPSLIHTTTTESNLLVFNKNQKGIAPKTDLKRLKPYQTSPYKTIHMFYIYHKDDSKNAIEINNRFTNGFSWFRGLQEYANILFYPDLDFNIEFTNKQNPIPEIEHILSERDIKKDVKYIAIYLTPYSIDDTNYEHHEIYYKVKELLLKRRITSQVISPKKMYGLGQSWVYSLPNIAVAILAKLDGIPWRLNTPINNELIVGVGAFKRMEENIQYIGSAFSFSNDGKFKGFEYFTKNEIELLAGKISSTVHDYATINNNPSRLIIHFYKTMNEKELYYIEKALHEIELKIPIFIVSINKTESKDIVAFDNTWDKKMPLSGTFIKIGDNKYLLFNNTRYTSTQEYKNIEGFPFPIKLNIDCTQKDQLKDKTIIQDLIDQVYQFSRMYWKSVKQQNLPVTIKYPEMVAQIAPHFEGNDIPAFGKDNLWFL